MSEARIDSLSNESNTGGPTLSGITTFSGTNYFVPPVGNTGERPDNPQKGSIRFNTDTKHLEYYRGDGIGWAEIEASNEELDGGTRGVWAAGHSGTNIIDYITISTLGDAIDFGDTSLRKYNSGGSSRTRGVFGGGDPAGSVDTVEYVTISVTGDAIDFGNLTTATTYVAGCSNQIRLLIGGGKTPSFVNTIQYLTIASTGDAADFGDLTLARSNMGGVANPTRGVFAGGYTPTNQNIIDYVTIASTGDAQDFGDITTSIGTNSSQCGSTTRGIVWGGYPAGTNIDYFTFSTKGNAVHFGDTTMTLKYRNCTSDTVRGIAGGGQDGPGAGNTIEYITIASTGDAADFGDLTTADHDSGAAFSNGHGGL